MKSARRAQAAGKGIGRPSFRVIQNHFAREANVGDVAAKEEVWEVSAQLLGLAASVGVLETMQAQDQDSAAVVVGAWALFQGAHIALRCAVCCRNGRADRSNSRERLLRARELQLFYWRLHTSIAFFPAPTHASNARRKEPA